MFDVRMMPYKLLGTRKNVPGAIFSCSSGSCTAESRGGGLGLKWNVPLFCCCLAFFVFLTVSEVGRFLSRASILSVCPQHALQMRTRDVA